MQAEHNTQGPAIGGEPEEGVPAGVRLLRTLDGHEDAITSLAFGPQGWTMASGSYDHTVKLWDARSGKLLRKLEGWRDDPVFGLAFDPQGKTLAAGAACGTGRGSSSGSKRANGSSWSAHRSTAASTRTRTPVPATSWRQRSI